MTIDLSGKNILITGASSGIGKAIAENLSQAGATLAVHYHSNIESATSLAKMAGKGSLIFRANLADNEQVVQLFQDVLSAFGKIDVLVNNAGIYVYAPLTDEAWLEKWQITMQTNLTSAALLSKLAISHFKEKGGGRIINIASRAAFRGDTGDYMAYAASKGGMISLTKTIARAYGKSNIMAFSIAPGFVRTPMATEFIEKNGEDNIIKELSLNTLTKPMDVAPLVTFISAGFLDHATGSTFDINAGSYMR
jgi:NAD(P)-dependent dehydrogenase (short-subunit alcohol dehydrogenase family)